MKIRIPKLRILLNYFEKPEGWIGFILVFNCIYPALVNFLNIPMAINYLNDLLCGLLLLAVFNSLKKGGIKSAKIPAGIFLALFIETALSYIFNLYSPLIYIWGLRTLFRYFVFFFSCTMFVKKTDIESVFNFLYKILFVNLVFATMEYAMKYKLDSVTGLYSFGPNIPGGSAPINVLMCVVCAYYIIKYFEKQCSLLKMIFPILASVYISAIGEIKAFYFELVIIIVLCSLFTKFSWKKLIGILGAAVLLIVGLNFYAMYYGGNGDFFTFDSAMSYSGADGSTYGKALLNRTTAMPFMWKNFLTNPIKKLFGLGLGYADTVSFSAFSSGFAARYSFLGYQYWFTSLELTNIGIVGLILLALFYAVIFIYTAKLKAKCQGNRELYSFVQVIVILTFIWAIYNQSLILDTAAFMIYWILAIPYILANEKQYDEKRKIKS